MILTQRNNQKFLILTCDSEAVPGAAPSNHVERLIWGKFPGAPYEAGIGKLMDIAEEFGVKIVFFHDVLEQHSYGDETGRAARYIVSRGHDLQLHMHAEFLPSEFWARIGRQTPTWSMNLYDTEAATHIMAHGVQLFEKMVGFRPLAYRAGAFRYNARILEALGACRIPLSFQYYPISALKSSYPHGFDAGVLPVFKWSNGVVEVPLTVQDYPHPRKHPFRYGALELNQLPGGADQALSLLRGFWENGSQFSVAVMLMHSWSFLHKNESGHYFWKDDSLVRVFSDFLKNIPSDIQVITATELHTKVLQKEVVPAFELPIQVAGTDGIPLLPRQDKPAKAEKPNTSAAPTISSVKSTAVENKPIPPREDPVAAAIQLHEQQMRELRRREIESYPHPTLENIHLRGAQLLVSRYQLLDKLPKRGTVCQLGVTDGDFSAEILERCEPARLHLVDPWDSERGRSSHKKVCDRFADLIADGRVRIHLGTAIQRLADFPDDAFDWVYIDTVHDYLITAEELAICLKKVKPGGIITGHDHTPGNIVTPVLYGVIQAVQEFCVKHRWRYSFLTCESNGYASFAIQAIDASPART